MNIIRSIDSNKSVVIVEFSPKGNIAVNSVEHKTVKTTDYALVPESKLEKVYSKVKSFLFKNATKDSPTILIPATNNDSMQGAGIRYKKQKYITHSTLPAYLSALKTFDLGQKLIASIIGIVTLLGLIIFPLPTLKTLVSIASILYFIDVVFNLIVVMRSLDRPGEIQFTNEVLENIDESILPMYTVLCPLYKEAHILPQFLDAINKLDYPKEKLDVLLLLEKDDKETIKILERMTLPYYVKMVIVPPSLPKTKPKACNYGLSLAKGEYLVIFDAEDIPEPMQLKKAYVAFNTLPDDVQCLQAKLNYYNPRANMLTKFFTVEYALWFEIMLSGLQSFNSTLPLGGTSNHFRTDKLKSLHGWDPFNVTEDADLGVRLFQKGYRTAVIDSITLEEATSKVNNWIRQRSRWLKGYMQTYLVHTRNHKEFVEQKGIWHFTIFQLTVGGKILFVLINPLMWVITTLYFTSYAFAGPLLEAIYTPPISYIAVTSWIFGNFLFVYYYMIACGRKKEWDLMKYVFLIPFYWMIMSVAGAIGFYQLIFKPHYWEKTVHGFHLAGGEAGITDQAFEFPQFKPNSIIDTAIAILKNNIYSFSNIFKIGVVRKSVGKGNNILILNWRDTKHIYSGGAEVYIQELAKRWVQAGNTVTIFCGNDYKNTPNETIDGVNIIRRGGTFTVYAYAAIYYLLKFRKNVDLIIDCENGIPFFSPLFARVPVILLIHHVHQEIFREFLKFPARQIAAFLEGKVMPFVYRHKQIVTVSNSSMQEILRMGISTQDRIEIIPNGVVSNGNLYFQKTLHPSFMYLGRLKNYKNIDVAIKAFAKVQEGYSDAVLSIVGNGETYPKLKKLVESLNLEENVRFMGKVTEEEKIKLLHENWTMLQPSQMEGWGITVIEANTCGTPVIASNVNGLKDSVIDGKTGLLVQAKNVDQFSEAMIELIKNEDFRARLSENALNWSQNFSWDKSANDFQFIIDKRINDETQITPAYSGVVLSGQES